MMEKVTYNKAFGIFLVVGALFIVGVSFVVGFSFNTLTGVLLLVMGILYLNNAALEYDKTELRMKNLYGGVVKRFSFQTDKIEMRDGAIYSNNNKIRVGGIFLNRSELKKLQDFIEKKEFLK
jgi:hypothetical protein